MNNNSKKKILYIHHGKGIGGAPLSLLYLIENLDKQKYHPIVLFLHDSEVVELYKSKGIEVVGPINEYDFPHTKIWWLRWYHFPFFLKILFSTFKTYFFIAPFWLKKIKPDLIHLNTSSLIAWGKAANKLKIPVIWHVREPLADGYFGIRKKIVQKCVAKYATKILPICKNDAKPWENNLKTDVVYNAVDLTIFCPSFDYAQDERADRVDLNLFCPSTVRLTLRPLNKLGDNAERRSYPTILFLGGLSKEKGTLLIFKVFEKLLEKLPNAKLIVAGYFKDSAHPEERSVSKEGRAGWDIFLNFDKIKKKFPAQKFEKEVADVLQKIKNNVEFLGPIKNVPQIISESDVLVFPATVGHFARPIIEASCMAKPVVASNLPPLNELVINGKTGFLIDTSDIDLWVEKLYKLLTDEQLNRKMGFAGFEFATKNFDVKLQIQKIEKIYSEVLERDESGKIKKRSNETLG
ncbi:MAG: glycosyltransferase family 4 protein [bacterium]